MAMGRRGTRQQALWIATEALPRSKGDPFYERLNEILGGDGFDEFVEKRCERHYAQDGRPGLAPGRYFRWSYGRKWVTVRAGGGVSWE